jgi:hypothetical protein
MKTGTGSRRRGFALVLVGLVLGGALWASPATSHVADWTHNWVQHIRPKADARYYTKTQADVRYLSRSNVAGSRVTAVSLDVKLLLSPGGMRLQGTCGINGGTLEIRNMSGGTIRVMSVGTATTDVANTGIINFPGQTTATPRTDVIQVAWGPGLARMTTFTVSWTAAAGGCEYFSQAVTKR